MVVVVVMFGFWSFGSRVFCFDDVGVGLRRGLPHSKKRFNK